MNSSLALDGENTILHPETPGILMTRQFYQQYVFPTILCLQIPTVVLGVLANPINIYAFIKMGRQDPVTFSFLVLSLCDFVYILIVFVIVFFNFISAIYISENRLVRSGSIQNFLIWYATCFYDAAVVISSYIGVTRACCVVFPLNFKTSFTLYRTRIALIIIFIIVFLLRCPMLVTQRLTWSFNSNTNISVLVLQQNRGFPLTFHNIINKSVLSNVCFIIAIISLIVLTIKLREATKFRRATSSVGAVVGEGSSKKEGTKINSKDLQVIKAVTLVTLIYVACNLPTVLNSILRLAFSWFDLNGNSYLYLTVLQFTTTLAFLNSSINIFVYYNYNPTYRRFLRSQLGMTK